VSLLPKCNALQCISIECDV